MRSIEGGEGKKGSPTFLWPDFFLQATMPPWLDLEKWNCTTTITIVYLGQNQQQLYAVSQRKNPPKVALIWVIFQVCSMDHGVEIKHENLPTKWTKWNKEKISYIRSNLGGIVFKIWIIIMRGLFSSTILVSAGVLCLRRRLTCKRTFSFFLLLPLVPSVEQPLTYSSHSSQPAS